jgi:hypothetical protein
VDAKRRWKRAQRNENGKYEQQLRDVERANEELVVGLRGQLAQAVVLRHSQAKQLVDRGEFLVDASLAATELRAQPRGSLVGRAVNRVRGDIRRYERLEGDATRWREQAKKLLESWTEDPIKTEELFDLLMAVPDGDRLAAAYVARLATLYERVYNALGASAGTLTATLTKLRADAIEALQRRWHAVEKMVHDRLDPLADALNDANGHFESEMRKAGQAPAQV